MYSTCETITSNRYIGSLAKASPPHSTGCERQMFAQMPLRSWPSCPIPNDPHQSCRDNVRYPERTGLAPISATRRRWVIQSLWSIDPIVEGRRGCPGDDSRLGRSGQMLMDSLCLSVNQSLVSWTDCKRGAQMASHDGNSLLGDTLTV